MKILKMFFRDEAKMSVDVVETWEVRWESRWGDFSGNTSPEIKVFPSSEDANAFSKALKDAFKLVKNTSDNRVTVSKSK